MKNSGIEWIGRIPDSWQLVNIGNVLKEYKNENKLLDTHALQFKYGTIVPKKETNTSQEVLEILSKYNVVKPNIIMVNGLNLAFDFVTQRVALVKENGVITSTYIALLPQNLVVSQYATYVLKSYDFQKVFHSLGRGLRCMLSYDILRREKMPLPSLDEQKSIVNCLEQKLAEVDKLIEVQQAQIEKLKEYKQSVITEAVTKGLDLTAPMKDSGVEWIGKIPEDWETIRVKQLLNERIERSLTGQEEPLSMSQKVGLVPTRMLDSIPNMASSFIGAKLTYVDDLVFNKLKAHLGVFSVSKYDGLVSPDYAVYYSTGKINLKYLEYLFKTPQCILEFRKRSTGIAVGLTRLYTDGLFAIECPFPNHSSQMEIVAYLDDKCAKIDKLIELKQSKIEKLQEYKKSLIYEYVTGKKEVI